MILGTEEKIMINIILSFYDKVNNHDFFLRPQNHFIQTTHVF